MKKRLMALLLVLCMVLGMFPTTASAADAIPAADLLTMTGYELGGTIGSMGGGWLTGNAGLWCITISDSGSTPPSGTVFEADTQYYLYVQSRSTDLQLSVNGEMLTPCNSSAGILGNTNYWFELPMLGAEAPAPATYNVIIGSASHGEVTADKATAAEGETVTLNVWPEEGWALKSLTVGGTDVTAQVANDQYSFEMPAKDVSVAATFMNPLYPNRVNIQLSGYEIGKVAKYASVKMYDTNGTDVTAGEWYCCIVDSNEGCNWNIGELKANTRYWLRIERYISGYKASDFGLMDMEAVSVTDSSGGGNFLIYIELPMLEAPAPAKLEFTLSGYEALADADSVSITTEDSRITQLDGAYITDDAPYKDNRISGMLMPETQYYAYVTIRQATNPDIDITTITEDTVVLNGAEVLETTVEYKDPNFGNRVGIWFKLEPLERPEGVNDIGFSIKGYEIGGSVADIVVTRTDINEELFYDDEVYVYTDFDNYTDASGSFEAGTDYWVEIEVDGPVIGDPNQATLTGAGDSPISLYEYDDSYGCYVFQLPQLEEVTPPAPEAELTFNLEGYEILADAASVTITTEDSRISSVLAGELTVNTNGKLVSGVLTAGTQYYGHVAILSSKNPDLPLELFQTITAEDVVLSGAEVLETTVQFQDFMVTPAQYRLDIYFQLPVLEIPDNANVIIGDLEHASVLPSTYVANSGDTVNLAVTVESGYVLDQVTVTDANGNAVEVKDDYSFVMPDTAVTVQVTTTQGYVKFILGDVTGEPGETVKVPLRVETNLASATQVKFTPKMDWDHLSLPTGKAGDITIVTGNGFSKISKSNVQYDGAARSGFRTNEIDEGVNPNGLEFTVDVKIAEYAAGSYTLDLYGLGEKNGTSLLNDGSVIPVDYIVETGTVTVAAAPGAYDITVNVADGGTVVADKESADEGDTVTLTVTPAEGYKLESLTVTDANGAAVAVTDNTFVMPASDVTVSAVFYQHTCEFVNGLCDCGEVEEGAIVVVVGDATGKAGDVVTVPVSVKSNLKLSDPNCYFYPTLSGAVVGYGASGSTTPTADTWKLNSNLVWSQWIPYSSYGLHIVCGDGKTVDYAQPLVNIDLKISDDAAAGSTGTLNLALNQVKGWSGYSKIYVQPGTVTVEGAAAPTAYTVTVNEADGGKVTADKATAEAGETVTLTVEAMEAETCLFELKSLTVSGAEVTKVDDTTYTFVMPAADVTVNAEFEQFAIYPVDTWTSVYDGAIKAMVNGKEVDKAKVGETVTLVVAPKEGYMLREGTLRVFDTWMREVTLTKVDNTTYTFVMPDMDVEVTAYFDQYVVDGKSVATLSCQETALAGDLVNVTLNFKNSPSGKYNVVESALALPEGWKIVGAKKGDVNQISSNQEWQATSFDNGNWGLWAVNGVDSLGIVLPQEGDVLTLQILIPQDAEPGLYKLDLTSVGMTLGWSESSYTYFGQCIDTAILIEQGSDEPLQLVAPELSSDCLIALEDMIYADNAPASLQDVNAAIEYSISTDNVNWTDWAEGSTIQNMDMLTDHDIRIVATGLSDDTTYYVRARYVAFNTRYYANSEASETLVLTTKAWNKDPVTISVGTEDLALSAGDTFTVPVIVDHNFSDDQLFFQFRLGVGSTEQFTLVSAQAGADLVNAEERFMYVSRFNYVDLMYGIWGAGSMEPMPEGELVLLTYKVNDTVEPGTYELPLRPLPYDDLEDGWEMMTYLATFGGDSMNQFQRQYPANVQVNNLTVTVRAPMSAPVLTDAVALEDSITVIAPFTVDGVKVEYSISADGRTWSAWQESNVFEGLDANTEYQIRARYVPEATSKYGNSEPSNIITATTTYDDILFTVADGAARTGKTVTVPVTVSHKLTKDATSIVLVPAYDTDKLALDSVTLGDALTGDGWKLLAGDEIQIYKSGSEAFTVPEGEIAVLTFNVLDDAAAGDTDVTLSAEVYNDDALMNVEATYNAGTVHIHDETVVEGYAATCYADGMTNGLACSLCDEVFTEQYVIESKGHVLSDEVVAPTHDCKGYTVTSCANCDYSTIGDFTDALDHDYAQTVTKEATCVEEGEWTFICECGDSYTLVMPKTGHDCDAVVTEPTCTEGGYTTHTCKHCEFSYFTDLTEATGHKPVVIDAKEPTEDEEGYTGDTVCEVCEEVLEKGEVIPALKHTCPAEEYSDVDTGLWYHDAIDYVLNNGLMNGVGGGKFAPNAVTTRGQLVTILYRAAGSPSVAGMSNPFADVAAGTYYTDAVIWAANNGVTKGTSATTFAPDATITRQDLVTILFRYSGGSAAGSSVLNGFGDAGSVSGYAKDAMSWAVANGIINGSGGNLLPKNNATRAQIAQILMNYMG